jgi:hypothetical protein
MLPIGLALIAQDVPFLRRPLARLVAWISDRLMRGRETDRIRPSPPGCE